MVVSRLALQLGERLQWLCRDDSIIKIVLGINIIVHEYTTVWCQMQRCDINMLYAVAFDVRQKLNIKPEC